jgi:hypothetical protein
MRGRFGAAAAAAVMIVVAWAAPARSQDQAAAFRQTIEGWLATMGARTGAPITVRDDGGGLVATLPDVVVAGPDETLRLGTIVVARREAAGGRQRYDAALPREIRIESRNGPGTITVDDGAITLEVDPRTNIAHMSEGRFTNLTLQNPGDPRLTIALAEFSGGITGRADGLSDSPGRARVQGLRFEMQSPRQTIAVGELLFTGNLLGFRLSDYEPLHIATESAVASGDPRDLSRAIEQWLAFPFATMPIELSIADFVYGDGSPTPVLTIARASFSQTFESLANPQTGYSARYVHEGVALRDDQTPFNVFVPSAVSVAMVISGLPSGELRDALSNGIATGTFDQDSFWSDLFDSMITAAVDNGAEIRVAPFELTSPALAVSASANLTGNDRSPLSAVGTGDIVIRGLEDAARALLGDPQGSGPDSPAAAIAIISAMGQAGTDSSGRPTRSYHIELDEQGRVMLNGNDLSALIGGGGGGPPQQQQQQPQQAPGK